MTRGPLDLTILTSTQLEILRDFVNGEPLSDVARRRGTAHASVCQQLKAIIKKLGCENRIEMTIRYWRDTRVRIL